MFSPGNKVAVTQVICGLVCQFILTYIINHVNTIILCIGKKKTQTKVVLISDIMDIIKGTTVTPAVTTSRRLRCKSHHLK